MIAAAAAGLGAAPASAAQPPPGYPTSQVMATASNPTLGSIQIRRGFYDNAIDQGWGMDKAWNKHNIWSVEAMRRVMLSTNITPQGLQYLLKAYAGKYQCSGSTCTLTDQREVRGIYDTQSYTNYYGWPVGGKMGQLTMYCYQGGELLCPNWVTYSITNPGVNNPYRSSSPSADTNLSAEESSEQAEILSSDEIVTLDQAIAAGDEQVAFSYEPLPEVIDAP
ncbi:hypothetical protein [Arthrobacter ulcerisalmonis]|uniref:hypothetical protein n=1 Tax=Arthrobacter ulcerisalmonis TaxID=2483813 RepID=UPI000F522C9A|nr:hypothetical protein [Arthrobacter ulcerisalmonis]